MTREKPKKSRNSQLDVSSTSARGKLLFAEGALLGWLALCVILFLSLLSYSPQDPGWSHTGTREGVSNLIGPAGAWMSDIGFALFGMMAYLLPLLLAVRALQILRTYFLHEFDDFDSATWVLRVVGFMLVMISATSLANIQYQDVANSFPEGMGGILGKYTGDAIISIFSHTGSTLLLLALFLFGLTVFFVFSWIKLIDRLGLLTMIGFDSIRQWHSAQRIRKEDQNKAKAALAERIVKVESAVKKQQTRVPPAIQSAVQAKPQSPRVLREQQQKLFDDSQVVGSLPPINLLDPADKTGTTGYSADSLEHLSRLLELKLQDFGISAEVVEVLPVPVVTWFEIQPAAGIKVSRISGLAKDLARSMAVISVRVVEVIPGKSVVGIEIPN